MNNLLPQEKIDFTVGQKGHRSNDSFSISEATPPPTHQNKVDYAAQ